MKSYEQSLIERIKSHDKKAFRILFDRYYRSLCFFACKYVSDLIVAEDLVQDLFVKLWDDSDSLNLERSLNSYLYKAVKNSCLNHLKHLQVENKYIQHKQELESSTFFQEQMEQEELRRAIYSAIEKLPPSCKKVFELSRFDGLKHKEIAREMGISVNTVKAQMVKAIKTLRKDLENRNIFHIYFILSRL